MTGFPAAASLARALVMLERAGASGDVEASAPEGRASFAIREGRVLAVEAPNVRAPQLGRLLVDSGVAADAVERIANHPTSGVRVGDAVVRAGLAGQGAISHALRLQMRARVRAVARWPAIELRFERGVPVARAHVEPIRVGELLLGAMRESLETEPPSVVRARIGLGTLKLTALGEALIGGAPLWPDEQAVCEVLRRGAPHDALAEACRASARAMRLVLALRWLEGAAPPPTTASLSLLARKTRQIRRAESPEELLDLPPGAPPEEARRAWRKLAGSLHPDRFAARSPAELTQMSEEVACALSGAARSLRATR